MDKKGRKKRATSQERWELDRIRAGGAIGAADIPDYDEEAANVEAEESEGINAFLLYTALYVNSGIV